MWSLILTKIKNNGEFFILGFLILIVISQSIQIFFLQKKLDKNYASQIEELEKIKENHTSLLDSLSMLTNKKMDLINQQEKILYENEQKAILNNKKYEIIKNKALTTTNADSLAYELTKWYN